MTNVDLGKLVKHISTLEGHSGSIVSIGVDDTYIYSGSKDATIRIWKKGTWKLVKELKRIPSSVLSIAVDNEYIYAGSEAGTVWIWKKGTWEQVTILKNYMGSTLATTVDNKFIYTGTSEFIIRIWEKNTWKKVTSLNEHLWSVYALAVDDDYVYSGSADATIRVWQKGTWKQIAIMKGHSSSILAIALDNNYIYSGSKDKTVIVWKKGSWKLVKALRHHKHYVNAITHDDQLIYTASSDKTVCVWKKNTWNLISTIKCHSWAIYSIASDNQFIYTGSSDKTIRIWDKQDLNKVISMQSQFSSGWIKKYNLDIKYINLIQKLLGQQILQTTNFYITKDFHNKIKSIISRSSIIPLQKLKAPEDLLKDLNIQTGKTYAFTFEFLQKIKNSIFFKISNSNINPKLLAQDLSRLFQQVFNHYKEYVYNEQNLIVFLKKIQKAYTKIKFNDLSAMLNAPNNIIQFVVTSLIMDEKIPYKIDENTLILSHYPNQFSRIVDSSIERYIPSNRTKLPLKSPIDSHDRISFENAVKKNTSLASIPTQTFGEYIIERVLGQGSYGTVFQAYDASGRKVAIKVMNSMDSKMKRKFLREVGFWRSLKHENIVRLLDYSTHPEIYLVMELMEGDLRSQLKQGIKFDFEDIVDIIIQVAMGLQYAHEEFQFIHRDIKPENILYRDVTYKLTDWGLAKLAGSETRSGYSGSVPYSAPEQFYPEFGEIGPWTDVWQLGVVFYELLTGELPFGRELSEVIRRVKSEDPGIPASLDGRVQELLKSMLAKQPQNRIKLKEVIKVLNTF